MTFDNNPANLIPLLSSLRLYHASLSHLLPRLGLIASLVIILVAKYLRSPWRKVPPGPKGLPILGNALRLHDKSWMYGKECKQKFETAFELLDRRANIYSDRPRIIVGQDILCGGLLTALMPDGDLWRRNRRAAHEVLTKAAVRSYRQTYLKEAIRLAAVMLENPGAMDKHIQRSSASATISILYDHPTLEERDKSLIGIHTFIDRLSAASAPGAHLADVFPWMIHIPERFAKWKREGMEYFRQHSAMFNGLLDSNIAKGFERPSVSASLMNNSNRSGLSNNEIAWLLGTLYTAGAETTATTMCWWTRAMIAHPEIQKRAQDELDAVVGRSRTPTFADAPNLHYTQALVKESLRWRPPIPLGVPHATTEDDWYEGMFIPKGTMCMVNLWQCHHDPETYGPDAASFNPERYLDEHGKLIPGPVETRGDGHSAYGFGKRICVGRHAANDSLFIDMATVLWAVRLERALDENGKEIPPDTESTIDLGTVFRPVPYTCRITPRFPEASTLLTEQTDLLKA